MVQRVAHLRAELHGEKAATIDEAGLRSLGGENQTSLFFVEPKHRSGPQTQPIPNGFGDHQPPRGIDGNLVCHDGRLAAIHSTVKLKSDYSAVSALASAAAAAASASASARSRGASTR